MLVIRRSQMDVLADSARQRFAGEMIAHSRKFSPRLSEVLGDAGLEAAVGSAIARAAGHGFTNRGPIRLFVELTFLFGSAFETDPQYPVVGRILRADYDQMVRARQLHEWHNDYLARVSGPGATNVHRALRDLLTFARSPLTIEAANLENDLLREMARVFEEKATFVGDDGLKALIREGMAEADRQHFTGVRPVALLVILKFAFGHGCTDDPLYPWIRQTLNDPKISGAALRAARLEKKAITWLEHVVARNEKRAAL